MRARAARCSRRTRRRRDPPRPRPGRRSATTEAATSVGARSSFARGLRAGRPLQPLERVRAEHAEAPRVGQVVVRRPAASSNSSSRIARSTAPARRPCACGGSGSARAGPRREKASPRADRRRASPRARRYRSALGRADKTPICRDWRISCAAHRRDVQHPGGPAGRRARHGVNPDRAELLALLASSWRPSPPSSATPSLRLLAAEPVPGLDILAFDEQAGRAVVVQVTAGVDFAEVGRALPPPPRSRAGTPPRSPPVARVARGRRAGRFPPGRAGRRRLRRRDARDASTGSSAATAVELSCFAVPFLRFGAERAADRACASSRARRPDAGPRRRGPAAARPTSTRRRHPRRSARRRRHSRGRDAGTAAAPAAASPRLAARGAAGSAAGSRSSSRRERSWSLAWSANSALTCTRRTPRSVSSAPRRESRSRPGSCPRASS